MKYKMTFLGLGVSNFAVLKNTYKDNPHDFFVSSMDKIAEDKRDFLKQHAIAFEEGNHSDELLDTELLMISPSVRLDNEIYKRAKQLGIEVKTDVELFLELKPPIHYKIAITGTNGKTTTVELIQHILRFSHEAYAVGNIGFSPFELINKDLSRAILVFELSSFQIEHLSKTKRYFDLSGLTNIAQDHLDWHGGFEAYVKSKMGILDISKEVILPEDFQFEESYKYGVSEGLNCVINETERLAMLSLPGRKATVDLSRLKLKGVHNIRNSALAAFCCFRFGIDVKQIEDGINTFVPGEHRMEVFFEWEGRIFVNDSKSTNAHALISAIDSFRRSNPNVRLLAGAKDKGDDYTQLSRVIETGVKKVYLCGESAQRLYDSIPNTVEKELFKQWHDAIDKSIEESSFGDVILFSPGGSSFDRFENYKKRGEYFKNTVTEILTPL
ncbi:MAG: UDP-N-acetylmuramoyl-L-alanine--D-glutamate ligase [Thermotogota bacterium]